MVIDTTINLTSLTALALAVLAGIGGWYKFGGRLDMLEYKAGQTDDTLKVIASILEKQSSLAQFTALVDQRVVVLEKLFATIDRDLSDLRRGNGWIKPNTRKGVDGEYE